MNLNEACAKFREDLKSQFGLDVHVIAQKVERHNKPDQFGFVMWRDEGDHETMLSFEFDPNEK